jgi:hypothetical protein
MTEHCSVAGWRCGSWCIRGPEKALRQRRTRVTLERKRYLLTTHLEQIAALVGVPASVVDPQTYRWGWGQTECSQVPGYWLVPHD